MKTWRRRNKNRAKPSRFGSAVDDGGFLGADGDVGAPGGDAPGASVEVAEAEGAEDLFVGLAFEFLGAEGLGVGELPVAGAEGDAADEVGHEGLVVDRGTVAEGVAVEGEVAGQDRKSGVVGGGGVARVR